MFRLNSSGYRKNRIRVWIIPHFLGNIQTEKATSLSYAKIRTSSMILSAYAQKLFSGVKNAQCQQHGTVKEYADSKNKLKVTPF